MLEFLLYRQGSIDIAAPVVSVPVQIQNIFTGNWNPNAYAKVVPLGIVPATWGTLQLLCPDINMLAQLNLVDGDLVHVKGDIQVRRNTINTYDISDPSAAPVVSKWLKGGLEYCDAIYIDSWFKYSANAQTLQMIDSFYKTHVVTPNSQVFYFDYTLEQAMARRPVMAEGVTFMIEKCHIHRSKSVSATTRVSGYINSVMISWQASAINLTIGVSVQDDTGQNAQYNLSVLDKSATQVILNSNGDYSWTPMPMGALVDEVVSGIVYLETTSITVNELFLTSDDSIAL